MAVVVGAVVIVTTRRKYPTRSDLEHVLPSDECGDVAEPMEPTPSVTRISQDDSIFDDASSDQGDF